MAKLRVTKKQVFIALGVVVLLAAAVGAGFVFRWLQTKDNTGQGFTPTPIPEKVTKVEELFAAGKTDEASQQINEALKDQSLSADDKYLLYLRQGALEVEKKNYQAGIDAYLKAEQAKQTYEVAGKIGSLYQLMGDNTKAIEYYKLAITRNTDENNPLRERENEMYTEMIKNIGGQL